MKKSNLFSRVLNKLNRNLLKRSRIIEAKKIGLNYLAPNFIYFPNNLKKGAVVIDAGCSYEADFSVYMIEKYSVKSYGIDPTRKHQNHLKVLETKYLNYFQHLPYAIGAHEAQLTFFESNKNESGSILENHVNIINDDHISYMVDVLTLDKICDKIECFSVEILKLDLEGAEYELINNINEDILSAFSQIFIEFHHHALEEFNQSDTYNCVEKLRLMGYSSFSLDDHNYLFYKKM